MEKIKIIYLLGLCQTNKANDNEKFFDKIKSWFNKDYNSGFNNQLNQLFTKENIKDDDLKNIINELKIEDIIIFNEKIKKFQIKVNINNIEDMYRVLNFINQQQKIINLLKSDIENIITNIKNIIIDKNEENNINIYIKYIQNNLLNQTHITKKDIKEINKNQFCITNYHIKNIDNPEEDIYCLMGKLNNKINLYMECIKKD